MDEAHSEPQPRNTTRQAALFPVRSPSLSEEIRPERPNQVLYSHALSHREIPAIEQEAFDVHARDDATRRRL